MPNLRKKVQLKSIFRNKSITAEQLRTLKLESGSISDAMHSMLDMLDMLNSYTGAPLNPKPEFPNVSFSTFHTSFGHEFSDTNNISLVTFLSINGTKFVIPGDLEVKGWESLLTRQDFIKELENVDVFIASHHGRENGYCPKVFDHCTPDIIIISDSEKKYATQEMVSIYGSKSKGINFMGNRRNVLTTRRDGTLEWQF